jgi:hypothetical protein
MSFSAPVCSRAGQLSRDLDILDQRDREKAAKRQSHEDNRLRNLAKKQDASGGRPGQSGGTGGSHTGGGLSRQQARVIIEAQQSRSLVGTITSHTERFTRNTDQAHDRLVQNTIGFQTGEAYSLQRKLIAKEERKRLRKEADNGKGGAKRQKQLLSFGGDESDGEDGGGGQKGADGCGGKAREGAFAPVMSVDKAASRAIVVGAPALAPAPAPAPAPASAPAPAPAIESESRDAAAGALGAPGTAGAAGAAQALKMKMKKDPAAVLAACNGANVSAARLLKARLLQGSSTESF